ncbi:MAG TPA: hypothetical protein PKL76_21085, partial [Phycisphaerae bacterium]|nr:hypothetical protein [Phycisphaerae bacterium]
GWTLPTRPMADAPGSYVVIGNAQNNRVLAQLVSAGLELGLSDLGDEGFRIFSHEDAGRRLLIIAANTPQGIKHGCQELVFFRLAVTTQVAQVDWPIDVSMKPQFAYRAIYMLPCWSAHDSIDSWRRVLKFNSELTLNRHWFWLAGFPLLPEYGGEYAGTDLANVDHVRSLVELCRSEGTRFYIGGGWFTFHHVQAANGSIERGARYYLDLFKLLPNAGGLYLEPPGEGYEVSPEVWRAQTLAMQRMMQTIRRCRPDFEFALAIGSFNNSDYLDMVHGIDGTNTYWWWCWGDPLRDNALARHSLILRWHTVVQMSNYHGSTQPPGPAEVPLTGFATSYDPGMGYGNSWNGWARMGVDAPRNFDPYTMPYFSHQYLFRERCWNVQLSSEQFAARMARRLFDADMPAQAIQHYLKLAEYCPNPKAASSESLGAIEAFVSAYAGTGTARNRDTLERMQEALDGIRSVRGTAPTP